MSQGPERRARKTFEPPPWELDQFEELRRKQEDERVAAEALRAHEEQVAAAAPQPVAPSPGPSADAVPETAVPPVAQQQEPPATNGAASEPGTGEGAAKAELPEGFEAMMAQLAVEEPKATSSFWQIGLAASVVLGLIGLVVAIWGVVALVKTSGPAGTMGGAIMEVFGIGFVVFGGWMAMRSLKQRGVL